MKAQSHHRYQVADLLKMPIDAPELQGILNSMDSDNNWDETDPTQKTFKTAGLTRYKLNFKSTIQQTLTKDSEWEQFESHTDRVGREASALPGIGNPSAGSTEIVVAEWALLEVELKVLKAAATCSSGLCSTMRAYYPQLAVHDSKPDVVSRAQACKAVITDLNALMEELDLIICKISKVPKDDSEAVIELIEQSKKLAKRAETITDVARNAKTKCKAQVDAL